MRVSDTIYLMKKVRHTFRTDRLLHDPVTWSRLLRQFPETYWISRGKQMALRLFREMAVNVPAYKRMLSKHRIQPASIRGQRDFLRVPIVDKNSYLRADSLPDLSWKGDVSGRQGVISATSGSSGEPFYFPRTKEQDLHYAAVAEMYLRTNFDIQHKRTLYIVGWGMGIWIGGVFSYSAVRQVAERGKYPVSIITPGANQEEILKALVTLGPLFDQVIIGGYPPMIKDLVDEGVRKKIPWKTYRVKFIFSAEGFSEAFRDYIIRAAGLSDIYRDTLNHYGTVDLGTMAHETPVSVLIRRIARDNQSLNEALFGHPVRQPTLAQYIPELFYFEAIKGLLVCSARSGLPLVRYNLLDTGGTLTYAQIQETCARYGVDLQREVRLAGLSRTVWNIPFVYVFERSDFTVKLSGANIFPQEIRRALEHGAVASFVTGKCTLQVDVNDNLDQYLTVHVELKKNIRASRLLEERIRERVIEELMTNNSEYAYLAKQLPPERVTPHIALRPFRDSAFFSAPGKHRWVRK